jgi:hypothetical protein
MGPYMFVAHDPTPFGGGGDQSIAIKFIGYVDFVTNSVPPALKPPKRGYLISFTGFIHNARSVTKQLNSTNFFFGM